MSKEMDSKDKKRDDQACFECPVGPKTDEGARCIYEVWDRALVLLLEQEEMLLGDMVEQYDELTKLAEEQAEDMADFLDQEA